MQKNIASQNIGVQMVTAADGTAFTGTVTVYVTGDAGTQALGSVGSGVCTHEGNGYHTYAPAQAETNYDLIAFTFIGTGAIPATVQLYTEVSLLAATQTSIDAIEADTNELQTDDIPTTLATLATAANLATVDTNVDAILVDTGTTLPATLATAQADLDIITGATGVNLLTATQASIDAIEADTNELQVDDVPGLIAALNNVSVADILTTQMTEAYAADGAAPTIAQALCAIQQFLQEKTVSGTTMTIKKLDGSTTAMTFTLNDATNPTNLTRAT